MFFGRGKGTKLATNGSDKDKRLYKSMIKNGVWIERCKKSLSINSVLSKNPYLYAFVYRIPNYEIG
jgi:hypothetical protein